MNLRDKLYRDIPWKDGGRTVEGCDCVGLAWLWLVYECGFAGKLPPPLKPGAAKELLDGCKFEEASLQRGHVVFFAKGKAREICHVGVWLGDGQLLHTMRGLPSRLERGFSLLRRLGFHPVGAMPASDERLVKALADPNLGGVSGIILLLISVALSAASALLMPKLNRFGNKYGRYGFDALATQNSTEIPLPDLLGQVVVAGNSPYTQLADKNLTATQAQQKVNKIVILGSGPVEDIDYLDFGITVNGLTYSDKYFKNGAVVDGFFINPEQSKAEAVTGSIEGDTLCPSISLYKGDLAIDVPVDIRAQYDRTFPLYGFNGCAYAVFRLIDSSKFSQFNLTARVKGRKCRTFDTDGFVQASVADETFEGDGSTARFKLANGDVTAITVTVDATPCTEISATNQSGDVFYVNRTRGYIEFLTAPGVGADVVVDYSYYVREWSQNPAMHLVYLLTEIGRGKGFDESKINWTAAVDLRDFCDNSVTWKNSNGVTTGPRFTCNYAIDFRKPIQEHIRAVLDSCYAYLFLSDGKFVMKARTTGASVFAFDESNILKDSLTSELVDRGERPNRIKAFFHTRATYNAETETVRDDVVDQAARADRAGNEGVVEENLKFPAVDNQEQAERLAETILREQVGSRWLCSFKTTVQGLALEPGDVVDVTHSSQPGWAAKLFRIEDLKHGPDDLLEIQTSEYVPSAY